MVLIILCTSFAWLCTNFVKLVFICAHVGAGQHVRPFTTVQLFVCLTMYKMLKEIHQMLPVSFYTFTSL